MGLPLKSLIRCPHIRGRGSENAVLQN